MALIIGTSTSSRFEPQVLALPVGLMPGRGRSSASGLRRRARSGERLVAPRHDRDLGVRVAADLAEGLGELAVRGLTPLEGAAIGMEGALQDAIAALLSEG
jgi:hypothetical protein